jgi:Periplasmic binding protein
MLGLLRTALLAAALSIAAGGTWAQDAVKIGAIYPLTGGLAGAGGRAKAAIEIGADIVNAPHPGLEKLPLGAGKGLPHLNGAKIEIVFADHQGNPPVGVDSATSDARFLIELKQAGQKIQTVAFVVEAGDDAAAMSAPVRNALRAAGFEVAADIG